MTVDDMFFQSDLDMSRDQEAELRPSAAKCRGSLKKTFGGKVGLKKWFKRKYEQKCWLYFMLFSTVYLMLFYKKNMNKQNIFSYVI